MIEFFKSLNGFGWTLAIIGTAMPIYLWASMPELWWLALVYFFLCWAMLILSD